MQCRCSRIDFFTMAPPQAALSQAQRYMIARASPQASLPLLSLRLGSASAQRVSLVMGSSNGPRPSFACCSRPSLTVAATAQAPPPLAEAPAVAPLPYKTTPFAHARSREELFHLIDASGLHPKMAEGMKDFFDNYEAAVISSRVSDAEQQALKIMRSVFDRVAMLSLEPYTFPSHHLSIREPFDYFQFGQDYIRPLIDFSNSYVGNAEIFDKMEDQLKEGHNIVLLSNHQTEADPAVLAHMLEHRHPFLSTELTYMAGDRVVLDNMCKPFSMGRNLLCVHSKKRLYDMPELAEEKLAANRRTLKEMAKLFKKGGNLIWIAPSGGRDRPDPATGQWLPAAFDPSAVELMRRLASEAGKPCHLHPVALLCYDIMPPPRKLEKELGERREIGYHGVGLAVAPEVNFAEVTANIRERKEARDAFSKAVQTAVNEQYDVLYRAIHGGQGAAAASAMTTLSQPWAQK